LPLGFFYAAKSKQKIYIWVPPLLSKSVKFQFAEYALELNAVGAFGCVFPIHRPTPTDAILYILD